MQELTARQREVLEYVRAHARREGKPPTIQEIGRALALRSTSGVHRLVSVLVERGYLTRAPRESRGVGLLERPGASSSSLPLLGTTPGETLVVDGRLLHSADPERCLVMHAGADYAEAAVREGDLLVIERMPALALQRGELSAIRRDETVLVSRVDGSLDHGVIGRVRAVVRLIG